MGGHELSIDGSSTFNCAHDSNGKKKVNKAIHSTVWVRL